MAGAGVPGIIACYRNNGERYIRVIGVNMKSRPVKRTYFKNRNLY